MAPVRPNVGHLIGDNEVMLDIDGALHIVTDHPAARHLWLSSEHRDLLVFGVHHLTFRAFRRCIS
jgi:hypothetical protein